jgi:methyl-accepting chemotaxis protein
MTGSVAEASARQSDASSAIAAAIEEMTVSINQISDNANETRQRSSHAAELANQGEIKAVSAADEIKLAATTVAQASERIAHLVESANQIGSIANVIKEIASQTNLLALNAAIEAARAGEQGRGFAVVADEVRGLAERTALATVQIEQMIKDIQTDTSCAVDVMSQVSTRVQSGVGLVEEATTSLEEIRRGAGVTLEHISDVADATREQSTASDAIAAQVEQIAQMVDDTSHSVREAAGALNQLENLSSQLHELVGRFRY